MTNHAEFKKEFQREIGRIRKIIGGAYPKAMMTSQQIRNHTATVNCGGEWKKTAYSKDVAEKVLADKSLKEVTDYYGVKVELEYNRPMDAYQVRLSW